ncbi:hypothetical protein AVEN_121825-1 [Araneus ventricosus]|uniref:Uncharacterized protein n=1 Tax=Araneus ventricosus TaxID=182803 RepID=A0A4Y2P2X7_ARAVE|nr:hypothetical protein AVEN_121825-1 [Araneus ventricosus]
MTDICGVPNVLEVKGKCQNDAKSLSPSKSYSKRAEYRFVDNCKTRSNKKRDILAFRSCARGQEIGTGCVSVPENGTFRSNEAVLGNMTAGHAT